MMSSVKRRQHHQCRNSLSIFTEGFFPLSINTPLLFFLWRAILLPTKHTHGKFKADRDISILLIF